jgi:hypothetical protein
VSDFERGQLVRLTREVSGHPAGKEGTVVAFYARTPPAVLVRFDEELVEVAVEELEPVS